MCLKNKNCIITFVRFLGWLIFAEILQKTDVSIKETLHMIHLGLHFPQDMEVINQDPTTS